MTHYTNIETFLEQLAQGIEAGQYTKATFPKALEEQEWERLTAELSGKGTAINEHLIEPFSFIGVLPAKLSGKAYTYDELSKGIVSRLELIKFAKSNIKDFTAVRH